MVDRLRPLEFGDDGRRGLTDLVHYGTCGPHVRDVLHERKAHQVHAGRQAKPQVRIVFRRQPVGGQRHAGRRDAFVLGQLRAPCTTVV